MILTKKLRILMMNTKLHHSYIEKACINAVFDSCKKRCTCKFKIFELSKRNKNSSALKPIAQQIFYSQSNWRKEAPFLSASLFAWVEKDLNPLRARAFFWALFFNYRKFNFVTQFLRNESTKIQSFVYHFVENFKFLHENVKFLS